MHCIQLAELAAKLADWGPSLIYRKNSLRSEAVVDYWVASKTRLDLWHHAISKNRKAARGGDWVRLHQWWELHLPLMEEILVSDVLARVVAAIADASERYGSDPDSPHGDTVHNTKSGVAAISEDGNDISPIAHAVHLNHLEIRNRVQQLMLNNRGCRVSDAVRLNRLRKAIESWTDAWLGRMAAIDPDSAAYGFVQHRVRSHADDAQTCRSDRASAPLTTLMMASMRSSLRRCSRPQPALPESNRRIAESVLAMLSPALFDDVGFVKSISHHRVEVDHLTGDRRPAEKKRSEPMDPPKTTEAPDACRDAFERWYLA